jgi:hypothetical protein
MRTRPLLSAAVAGGALALLAACSGGSQVPAIPGAGMTQNQSRSFSAAERSGVAPKFLSMLHFGKASPGSVSPARYRGLKALYVSDAGTGAVEILKNGTWASLGSISTGLGGPDGDFLDKKGNFYVANYSGVTIQEYKPHGTSPSFTYSSGMTDPVGVDVDTHGNVYEADYSSGGSGFVNEYAQGSNTVLHTCSPGGAVEGVAVDLAGDVFVDYNTPSSGAKITEYKGGLSGCKATVLGVTLGFAGGMVLDAHSNLIVCDQTAPAVDVIDPPYSSVTGTLGSGYSDPFHVTINKANALAFVADAAAANVQVLKYPSGTNVITLGSAQGLSDPFSAVDGPNAVY